MRGVWLVGLLAIASASERAIPVAVAAPYDEYAFARNDRLVLPQSKDKAAKKRKDLKTATAYNISQPIYICPKAKYVLKDEDCIFEDTVPARYECPVGYKPVWHKPLDEGPQVPQDVDTDIEEDVIINKPITTHPVVNLPGANQMPIVVIDSHIGRIQLDEESGSDNVVEDGEADRDSMSKKLPYPRRLPLLPGGFLPGVSREPELHRPFICKRVVPPTLTCLQGSLVDDECRVAEFTDPVITCPAGTSPAPHDTCIRYDELPATERCPEGTSRLDGACVRIDYIEPQYVCPGDSIQEGKKCRREVIKVKDKRRMLSEEAETEENVIEGASRRGSLRRSAAEEEDDEEVHFASETVMEEIDLAELDLPEYLLQSDHGKDCKKGSRCDTAGWLPSDEYDWDKKERKEREKAIKDEVKWQKVKVQMPVMKVKKDKGPKRVVKVQKFPAERVCLGKGEKYGSSCIFREIVQPIRECPLHRQEHLGRCIHEEVVPASIHCPVGRLVCPPSIPGRECKCETFIQVPPIPVCNLGGELVHGQCVSFAEPKPYCPLSYFLENRPGPDVCTRRDVEPALCLFSVTYFCPDCEERVLPPHSKKDKVEKEKKDKIKYIGGYDDWDYDHHDYYDHYDLLST